MHPFYGVLPAECPTLLLEGVEEDLGVRHEDRLGPLGALQDEASQRRQQVGVQARLGLVEDQQLRRAGRAERGEQQEVPERAVRQLCRRQRPQQPWLVQGEPEEACVRGDLEHRAGEGVVHRTLERTVACHPPDGLEGCCQVSPVVRQDRRLGADLRRTGRGVRVGTELVVEAPGTQRAPHPQHLGCTAVVDELVDHGLRGPQVATLTRPGT